MASPRSLELAKRLWGWEPHTKGQRDFMLSQAKVKTASCGRRWGKSECTAIDIVLDALEHPHWIQMLIAPTADQTSIIMDEVERRLYSIPGFLLGRDFNHRRSPYNEIEFRDAVGGTSNGHSLRTPTLIISRTAGTSGRGIRGRKAHKVICEEDAFISEKIMMNVITPLLADYDGQLVEISTPDGLNHFYEDFERGRKGSPTYNPRYESFQFPTSSNPYIPASYLANEKLTKPEAIYEQEYMAAFRSREGSVFRAVLGAIRAKPQDRGLTGHQYIFGVDWGRTNDFTVIAVCDVTTREIVHVDRFNEISWSIQRGRLRALYEKFLPVTIIAEANSIGGPNIEALQMEGLPVYAFTTTNGTKQVIVDAMVLALERGDIGLIDDPNLKAELMAYQGKKTPSGQMYYGAPEGKHDDTVIASCLVAWGMGETSILAPPAPISVMFDTPYANYQPQ